MARKSIAVSSTNVVSSCSVINACVRNPTTADTKRPRHLMRSSLIHSSTTLLRHQLIEASCGLRDRPQKVKDETLLVCWCACLETANGKGSEKKSAIVLARVLDNPSIESLNLDGNDIGAEAFQANCKMITEVKRRLSTAAFEFGAQSVWDGRGSAPSKTHILEQDTSLREVGWQQH
jgi:hypothetical protein